MYAVIHIPEFPLQACLRLRNGEGNARALADEEPIALLESPQEAEARRAKSSGNRRAARKKLRQPLRDRGKSRILGLTPTAVAQGVKLGMTASQGQARCLALRLMDRSPEAEAAARELLLGRAREITPDYEDTQPGLATLNLLGLRTARHEAAGREAVARLAAQGLRACVGIAPNPDLARLACELIPPDGAAPPVKLVEGSSEAVRAFLEPLPLGALHPPAELAEILRLWGLHTVRDYLALPLGEISQRLGREGVELWQLARGGTTRLLRLDRPPAIYTESWEFEYEVEQLDQLLYLLHLFLEKILARLAAVSLAAGRLDLRLTLRGGGLHERLFHMPEPCCDLELLHRVLSTHLETLTTPEPVVALTLEAQPARRGQSQPDFFERGLRDPNRFSETLARLEALLGPGRVGRPVRLDSHRPDAVRVAPFLEEPPPRDLALDELPEPVALGPPLRRFRPPRPARVTLSPSGPYSTEGGGRKIAPRHLECGEIRGPIREFRGPWPVSGEWWDVSQIWARQEWDIELQMGGLYRVAHEPRKNTWTLEGQYG